MPAVDRVTTTADRRQRIRNSIKVELNNNTRPCQPIEIRFRTVAAADPRGGSHVRPVQDRRYPHPGYRGHRPNRVWQQPDHGVAAGGREPVDDIQHADRGRQCRDHVGFQRRTLDGQGHVGRLHAVRQRPGDRAGQHGHHRHRAGERRTDDWRHGWRSEPRRYDDGSTVV